MFSTPRRPLTPSITTVEREPDFSHLEGDLRPGERLSRRDSFEHELRQAKALAEETKHSTIPAHAENIAVAISTVQHQDRERSRDRSRVRDNEPVRDKVQAAADQAYRESRLARRLEEDDIRSRSASPDRSVVEKWDETEEQPVVRIVTLPRWTASLTRAHMTLPTPMSGLTMSSCRAISSNTRLPLPSMAIQPLVIG